MPIHIDEVLDPAFVEGLDELSLDEVRQRRSKSQQVEVGLSYLRRMTQGRLDILVADIRRRAEGADSDLIHLLDHLTPILAEGIRGKDRGAIPTHMTPDFSEDLTAELDEILPDTTIANLPNLTNAEVLHIGEELRDLEKAVSIRRHDVHQCLDKLTAELVRRYKDDPAEVEALLQ